MSSNTDPPPARQGFFDRHLSLIITSIISLAAVAVSYIQFYDAKATREADLARQQAQREQSLELEQNREARELNIRLANFISENQDKVFSKDSVERARMRELILVAFRQDAESVFERLASVANDEEAKQSWQQGATKARTLEIGDRAGLVAEMFSDDRDRRIAATTQLIRNWNNDPAVVPLALDYASNNRGNKSGIINTLVYLHSAPQDTLRSNRDQIVALLDAVRGNGDQTAVWVDRVRARME